MTHHRPAPVDTPIHPLLAARWSPRAQADRPVDHDAVLALLEAARWSPSAYNAQPWRFMVFERDADPHAYARAFATLVPFNQSWNAQARVLIAVLADTLTSKGAPNPGAAFDAGAAAMAVLLQAQALDLAAHAMSGLDADAFRAAFAVPERFAVQAMISVAHHGPVEALPEGLAERERAPRVRRAVGEIAFFGGWGEAG